MEKIKPGNGILPPPPPPQNNNSFNKTKESPVKKAFSNASPPPPPPPPSNNETSSTSNKSGAQTMLRPLRTHMGDLAEAVTTGKVHVEDKIRQHALTYVQKGGDDAVFENIKTKNRTQGDNNLMFYTPPSLRQPNTPSSQKASASTTTLAGKSKEELIAKHASRTRVMAREIPSGVVPTPKTLPAKQNNAPATQNMKTRNHINVQAIPLNTNNAPKQQTHAPFKEITSQPKTSSNLPKEEDISTPSHVNMPYRPTRAYQPTPQKNKDHIPPSSSSPGSDAKQKTTKLHTIYTPSKTNTEEKIVESPAPAPAPPKKDPFVVLEEEEQKLKEEISTFPEKETRLETSLNRLMLDKAEKEKGLTPLQEKEREQDNIIARLEQAYDQESDPEQKRRIEQKRWVAEDQRREIEQKRWDVEKELIRLQEEINKINAQKNALNNKKKELADKLTVIEKKKKALLAEKERDLLIEKLEKLEKMKEPIELKWIEFNEKKRRAEEDKEELMRQEQALREKIHNIEKQEKVVETPDQRHSLEVERWETEKRRRSAEKSIWEKEHIISTMEAGMKQLSAKYQTILDAEHDLENKIKETEKIILEAETLVDLPL